MKIFTKSFNHFNEQRINRLCLFVFSCFLEHEICFHGEKKLCFFFFFKYAGTIIKIISFKR